MTRIAALLALTVATLASPAANAGLLSSPLGLKIAYSGAASHLSVNFALVDLDNGTVLDTAQGILEGAEGDSLYYTADLAGGGWQLEDNTEWCVSVNATAATQPINLGFLLSHADDGHDFNPGDNVNFAGSTRQMCVAGSMQ